MEVRILPAKSSAYGLPFNNIKVWLSEDPLDLPALGTLVYDGIFTQRVTIDPPYVDKGFYIRVGYINTSGDVFYSGNIALRQPGPDLSLVLGTSCRIRGSGSYGLWYVSMPTSNRPITTAFQSNVSTPLSFINTTVYIVYDDADSVYAIPAATLSNRYTPQHYYEAGFMSASGTNPAEWSGGMMGGIVGGEVEQGRYLTKQDVTWNMRVPTLNEFRTRFLSFMPSKYDNGKDCLAGMNGVTDTTWFITSDEYYGTFDSITAINNLGQTKPVKMDEVVSFLPLLTYVKNS